MGVLIWLVIFLILVSSATSKVCDRCLRTSKAAFYTDSKQAFLKGACGYGTNGTHFNVTNFVGATVSIFNKGISCGSCFQVRCTDKTICSEAGVNVTVTDQIEETNTAFMMSKNAIMAMAKDEAGSNCLVKRRNVDVEYERIPCDYKKNLNLSIRVEESSSRRRDYLDLTIKILYQGGQTDIVAVDMAVDVEDGSFGHWVWQPMNRKINGPVWEASLIPIGALKFRFKVTYGTGYKLFSTKHKHGLPFDWEHGAVYDSGIQFTKIVGQDKNCVKCDKTIWK